MNRKKAILVIFGTAVFLVGGFAGYNVLAEEFSKAEKLMIMKKEFEAADSELRNIKDPKESDAKGRLLKQKITEIGQLERELNPPSSEQVFKEKLDGVIADLDISEGLHRNSPKAIEILKQGRAKVEEIKVNKAENKKSTEELLVDIQAIYEIIKQAKSTM